jgi:predicted amidohydrolase YtcJ
MAKSYSVLSRRALLRTGGAALALTPLLAGLPQVALAQAAGPADRIFTGGAVLTMEDAAPVSEALAVKDGLILAVGTEADVMALAGPDTVVTDLGGRALLPGFFDAHGHVFIGGIQALTANILAPPDGPVTDIASLQQAIRDWVAANEETVRQTGIIMGFGYDRSTMAELRDPTFAELDEISTEHPVYLIHQSSHMGAANSLALEIAGVTRDTPNPPGGVIIKDADGNLTGILEENAHIETWLKLLSNVDRDGLKVVAAAGAKLWARFGYTTAEEGRSVPPQVDVLREVAAEGGFAIDVVTYSDILITGIDYLLANVTQDYQNRFRLAGAKLTIDGSPQGFTALRDRPYYDPVGDYPPGYLGYAAASMDQVSKAYDDAFANGVQIITHSNGEGASDMLLAALEAASTKYGANPDRRTVLIHGQFLREDQVDHLNRLDVTPSLFPMHTFYWGDWHRDHTVGPSLADNISPTGWVNRRGMKFSTHHDAPVAFPDSMRVLDATVTRRSRSGDIIGPDQRVDVMTALKAMTIWPAWHHFEDGTKGSLAPGKLADLVILSADPTAVDPDTIDQIKVAETIKEGSTVYDASAQEGALFQPSGQAWSDGFSDALRHATLWKDGAGQSRFGAIAMNAPHSSGCIARTLQDVLLTRVMQG